MRAIDIKIGMRLQTNGRTHAQLQGKIGVVKQISGDCILLLMDDATLGNRWFFDWCLELVAGNPIAGDPIPDEYSIKIEQPCVTCGRKNSATDKKCWWCETPNPTQARAS